jgi:hypothetical protein
VSLMDDSRNAEGLSECKSSDRSIFETTNTHSTPGNESRYPWSYI